MEGSGAMEGYSRRIPEKDLFYYYVFLLCFYFSFQFTVSFLRVLCARLASRQNYSCFLGACYQIIHDNLLSFCTWYLFLLWYYFVCLFACYSHLMAINKLVSFINLPWVSEISPTFPILFDNII